MEHFSSGPWTLIIAYAVAVIGSLIGLSCMARARAETKTGAKVLWTVFGAFAIGGIAIWLMHFIAMLGFDIPGSVIKYDAGLTALSAVVAVVVVGIGLSLVTLVRFSKTRLVIAGVLAGSGVAGMHYMGMGAIRFKGAIMYDELLVVLSVVIAIVAATAAFWFTLVVRTAAAGVAAGLIMGVAVTGMHYTGMAAVVVATDTDLPAPQGMSVFDLVFPVFVTSGLVVAVLLWMLFTASNDPFAEPARSKA
ncbi:MHYT domain-containing protein [Saccharothrix violaceirubra]|uniref:NO-binding membrane sensor protein with MHYT domain n=1 Tax=Saccharothrix violaceirubra TaxID=413306 RepID=A0A7W7T151_9PSEU|nr:MHYT domain-containing protein [Saccharothrix violaceirubra]MBB4963360.1 NO-binding membrane sensor protein with MHYT domain [Saccharothrix violaceirubra]